MIVDSLVAISYVLKDDLNKEIENIPLILITYQKSQILMKNMKYGLAS